MLDQHSQSNKFWQQIKLGFLTFSLITILTPNPAFALFVDCLECPRQHVIIVWLVLSVGHDFEHPLFEALVRHEGRWLILLNGR